MSLHPRDLPWRVEPPSPSARTLTVRWLGVAGYELVCDGVTLLLDPYLSRVSLRRFLFGRLVPNEARIRAALPGKVDGIVVGHSHFDHLLDVPAIARMTGARVWGSPSTANVLRASGLPEGQIVECRGGEEFELGPFRVRLVPSEHSRFGLGGKVPFDGHIPCSCEVPMRGRDYRVGDMFGIAIRVGDHTRYHTGSANLVDDEIRERDVDVALVCIAARFATDRFVSRILGRLTPRIIVPTHYDNFFRPAERSMKLLPRTAFEEFVDDVSGFSREITLGTLELDGSVTLAIGA
jgi:L-ascorbate metabolism protein UlaG (beta-lactamase superfamily)